MHSEKINDCISKPRSGGVFYCHRSQASPPAVSRFAGSRMLTEVKLKALKPRSTLYRVADSAGLLHRSRVDRIQTLAIPLSLRRESQDDARRLLRDGINPMDRRGGEADERYGACQISCCSLRTRANNGVNRDPAQRTQKAIKHSALQSSIRSATVAGCGFTRCPDRASSRGADSSRVGSSPARQQGKRQYPQSV